MEDCKWGVWNLGNLSPFPHTCYWNFPFRVWEFTAKCTTRISLYLPVIWEFVPPLGYLILYHAEKKLNCYKNSKRENVKVWIKISESFINFPFIS